MDFFFFGFLVLSFSFLDFSIFFFVLPKNDFSLSVADSLGFLGTAIELCSSSLVLVPSLAHFSSFKSILSGNPLVLLTPIVKDPKVKTIIIPNIRGYATLIFRAGPSANENIMNKLTTKDESNKLIEDLEIVTKFQREDFKIRPEDDGAKVLGDVTITEVNRKGNPMRINCRNDVGDTGYNIPYNVEDTKITFNDFGKSKCIIAIETGGMFDRLVENGFDESHEAILVHIKGQPARSTRRFLQRMHQTSGLPLLLFTDADPWSYRIYSSVAYGAIKTAHISHILATPSARYLGVTPSDIVNYNLPADDLTDRDISALKSIQTDPRFKSKHWRSEIELQLEINKKSEQQALAKYGLDFVTNTYLPEKLKELRILT